MKKVAFHNLGCKVNAYETEAMLQQLKTRGYEVVSFEETADVYVVNTCSVTNMADRKSRQMLHRAKKKNPDALVVAVGCYAQADPDRALSDEAVDLVIGNDQKGRLADLIEARENGIIDIGAVREYEKISVSGSEERTRAFLKIQDGCNQFCSYCLIPYVRGRVRSRREAEILDEAGRLSAQGFREVVLTGIHLSSYGLDFEEETMGTPLLSLIEKLSKIPDIARIRLGSLEPRIVTEEFARTLAANPKVCPHFHLSLQSGCDETLKRMNRRYTTGEYYEKCGILRAHFTHPAITTDVIVGFPGETEEEFETTRKFLERVEFYEMHVFKFSRRKGTRADRMPDQIPESVKAERSAVLLEMTERHSRKFRQFYEGKQEEILLETEVVRSGKTLYEGYTKEYVKGYAETKDHFPGQLATVILGGENGF
ncbi:tRNA (N(6)-L-threonylcarbamoyladenosine(37)-C(2))-methylthiotransferase MtaB [Hominifimenecus sp. rT4P-3]|uniref:tRNA (N(6)-L-threonylcarbamoyladenosine(37)-C(2))- methylthiotransferase MtaB n=1 Tax=Hominifimenecus sp. rT4P-3 TaxID=3242979 RepID=UPI003DA5CBCE